MSGVIVAMRRTLLSCTSLVPAAARRGVTALGLTVVPFAGAALAADPSLPQAISSLLDFNRQEVAVLTTALALLGFSVVASILLMHNRVRAARTETKLRADIGDLQAQADSYQTLLFAEPQIVIAWPAGGNRPRISGDTSLVLQQDSPQRILAFGT